MDGILFLGDSDWTIGVCVGDSEFWIKYSRSEGEGAWICLSMHGNLCKSR